MGANAYLKLKDYDKATELIQSCCQLIQKGDRDELKVYLLAFKMHCHLNDKQEAIDIFKQILGSNQLTAEPIIEAFNILVSNKLYDVALGLGGHLLKACEKFLVDTTV